MSKITASAIIQHKMCMYYAQYIGMPVGTSAGRKILVGVFPMFSDYYRAQHPDGTQILQIRPIHLADVRRDVNVRHVDQENKNVYIKKDILQMYQHYVEECCLFLKHLSHISKDEISAFGTWAMGPADKVYAAFKSVALTQDPSFLLPHMRLEEIDYLKRIGYCMPVDGMYPIKSGRVRIWDPLKMGYDLPVPPVSFQDILEKDKIAEEAAKKRALGEIKAMTDLELDVVTIYDENGEPHREDYEHDQDEPIVDDDLSFEDDELDFEL